MAETAPTPLPASRPPQPLACGNCGDPMEVLRLAGHYGRPVEIDLCTGCHLVWFDRVESARLTGPAMLELIGRMAQAQSQNDALAHRTLRPQAACPRCRGTLRTVHNRSRWGKSLQLECAAQHGAYQTFAEFLQEKGLLRPMSSADRAALLRRDGHLYCVNCGASVGVADAHCGHCQSVPSLFDVARLARALDPEGATETHAVHGTATQRGALQCLACGAALPGEPALQCAQCGATLAVSRLAEAHAQVAALGPALRQHAKKPAPHVVQRRMAVMDADLPRQREMVEQMRAETDARLGRAESDAGFGWFSGKTQPLRAVAVALVLWWVWRSWG
jgi:Zn-finger nucleic acid-binding protein/uncharacterized protein YbaR (Trm112 family)